MHRPLLAVCEQKISFSAQDALVLDTSQDIERKAWGVNRIPTMTRTSDFFAFHRQRALCGAEHLQLLGFNVSLAGLDLKGHSAHQLKDLAGDCMAPPSVALVTVSCIAAMRELRVAGLSS